MIIPSFSSKSIRFRIAIGVFLLLSSRAVFTQAQQEDEDSKFDAVVKRAIDGLNVGERTSVYPFITLENGFEAYGHVILIHHPVWNPQDKIVSHLKHEPGSDLYVKLKYLTNWFSDSRTKIGFSFRFINSDDKYFYKVGNRTLKSERQELLLHSLEMNMDLTQAISNNINFVWSPGYWTFTTELDEAPFSIEPASRGQYVMSGFALTDRDGLDYTTENFQSSSSVSVEFGLSLQESASSFTRFKLKTSNRIPLFMKTKLGLGARIEYLHAANRDRIPYFALPEVGSRNGLRSYSKERFRNFAVAGVNLEYTLPPYHSLETFLLTDLFTTADELSGLNGSQLHQDFGIGVRWLHKEHPVSAGVAIGEEGWRLFSKISIGVL